MRYHKLSGFPADVKIPKAFYRLVATRHAQESALDDKYGGFRIPINLYTADVFEIEIENGKVTQYGARARWNQDLDIVLIIVKPNVVKTAWLTERTDNHKSLDLSKYAQIDNGAANLL